MELFHLKAFYHVVITGSFSKAAEELFVSQPALSRQVAALEKELELQLFFRRGRQVTLTDAGRRLFLYVEKIISLYNEAKKEMLQLKDLETGELSIGASTTIANYLLPPILAIYQKRNPNIKINLNVGNSSQIEQMALENKVDIGLIAGKHQSSILYQEQFAEDELFLIVPPDHYMIGADNITPEQINQETFLCREIGSDTQYSLDILLENLDVKPEKTLVLGDTEAIKRGVISRMGIAFLSKYTIEYESRLKLLIPLKLQNLKAKRGLTCIYPKDARLSPAALAFLALLKKECAILQES